MKANEFEYVKEKSGVIPYYFKNGQLFVRLMKPSDPAYGGKEWQLAKGQLEDDLTPEENAVKEGHEEVGLKTENIKHIFELLHKRNLYVYAAEVIDPNNFDEPHYETGAVTWLCMPDEFGKIRRSQQWIFHEFISSVQEKHK